MKFLIGITWVGITALVSVLLLAGEIAGQVGQISIAQAAPVAAPSALKIQPQMAAVATPNAIKDQLQATPDPNQAMVQPAVMAQPVPTPSIAEATPAAGDRAADSPGQQPRPSQFILFAAGLIGMALVLLLGMIVKPAFASDQPAAMEAR